MVVKLLGYLVLFMGQIIDPIQPLPKYRQLSMAGGVFGSGIVNGMSNMVVVVFGFPILATITGWMYLKRATVGLENHLKPVSVSLLVLGIYELCGLAVGFRNTNDIGILRWVEPFGYIWWVEHVLLGVAVGILGKWVWSYLVKRLETELFMIFTTSILVIFLVTTVFFTSTAINNSKDETLSNLRTSVAVLSYTISGLQKSLLSDGQVLAQNASVVQAVEERDTIGLRGLSTAAVLAKKHSYLVILGKTGEILVRADDPDKSGGSMSDDPMVKRALLGEEVSSVLARDGAMTPEVSVRSITPIKKDGDVVGAVLVGSVIDSAFLDGLKSATGLDASVYGNNVRSATTLVAPDGKSRWVGVREETAVIKKTVLDDGDKYTGAVNILNVPYYAAYLPLKDLEDNSVGMLFVGLPQVTLMQAASRSIEKTFVVTAGLLVFSVIPAYFVSKFITDQIK
jgi:hypothetical protein